MNQPPVAIVLKIVLYAAFFFGWHISAASVLDFWAAVADTCYIYSPLDTPQGLWRGYFFLGSPISFGSAWEVSHAC